MEENMKNNTKKIILVHGAGHGAWCWYKVMAKLHSNGYHGMAIDLAASGTDTRRMGVDVTTFTEYSQPLLDIVRDLPDGEKAILVCHSLGGMTVALAMEMFPEKVAVAIFVSAMMPCTTETPGSVFHRISGALTSWMDCQFLPPVGEGKFVGILIGPEMLRTNLYQLSSPEDLALATTLVRQASTFQEDFDHLPPFSKDRYGSIDACYISCSKDLMIPLEIQDEMIAKNPVKIAKTIDTDHMVMFSAPEELCDCLVEIFSKYV